MTKIVIVGAGSLQFGATMLGDIFQSQVLTDAEILLNDINGTAARRTEAMARDYIADKGLKHRVTAEDDLSVALKGADVVMIAIEVGDRFALWDMDWRIPQQYGIPQVYGENGGPGGLFHALRITPPILEICRKVMDIAPKATVFNYSNPMSRIATTVHRAFPDLRFIGMCHEIASLERDLPGLLGQPRENLFYRAAGLNHFSVMTECRYVESGRDAYPDVRARAEGYYTKQPGYSEILNASRRTGKAVETEGWMDIDLSHITEVRPWSDRWLFKLVLERFGMLPITYDSHFGEYLQWAHEVSDHRGILDFYTYYRRYLGRATHGISPALHERAVPIIEGMLTDSGYEEAAVNIPNKGYIKDLPDWLVVEVPATVNASGVTGVTIDLPVGIRGLLANQVGIHAMTAEAILNGSRDLALQALMVDPVVSVARQLPEMLDHMIAEQRPWLDYLR